MPNRLSKEKAGLITSQYCITGGSYSYHKGSAFVLMRIVVNTEQPSSSTDKGGDSANGDNSGVKLYTAIAIGASTRPLRVITG